MNISITAIFRFAILILFSLFLVSSKKLIHNADSKKIEIRGIYGSPDAFWKRNLRLNELGVNAVFMHSGSINESILERARFEGLKVFAEFATLNGKNYVEKYPEAWAIDRTGNRVEAATWFMGVCPT